MCIFFFSISKHFFLKMSSILRKKPYILCIFFILRIHLMQLTKIFFSFIIEIYDISKKYKTKMHNYIFVGMFLISYD